MLITGKDAINDKQTIEWFWENRLPKKAVSLLAAMGGEGKSALALWIALTLGCKKGKKCIYVDTEQTFI